MPRRLSGVSLSNELPLSHFQRHVEYPWVTWVMVSETLHEGKVKIDHASKVHSFRPKLEKPLSLYSLQLRTIRQRGLLE